MLVSSASATNDNRETGTPITFGDFFSVSDMQDTSDWETISPDAINIEEETAPQANNYIDTTKEEKNKHKKHRQLRKLTPTYANRASNIQLSIHTIEEEALENTHNYPDSKKDASTLFDINSIEDFPPLKKDSLETQKNIEDEVIVEHNETQDDLNSEDNSSYVSYILSYFSY